MSRLLARLLARLVVAVVACSGLVVLGGAPPGAAAPGGGAEPKAAETSAVDAVLSGTVSTVDGGYLEAGVNLFQWQADGEYFEYWDESYLEGPDGSDDYSFTVPTGHYYVEATSYTDDYVSPVFSGGATDAPTDLDSPGVVLLTESGAQADLQLQAAPPRQPVTGAVVDGAGQPLEDVYVGVVDGPSYDEAYTGVDGSFELALRPGAYQLGIEGGEDYESASTDVVVDEDGATVPTITLAAASRWQVSGRVLTGAGTPLSGAEVALVRLQGDEVDGWFGDEVDWAETGADGSYLFEGARAGRTYTVYADAEGYAPRYAGGVARLDDDGLERWELDSDTQVGDLTLPVAVQGAGRVTMQGGPALGDASVVGYEWDELDQSWSQFDDTTTGEDGTFVIDLPETGSTVTFRFARGGYVARFLGGGGQLPATPDAGNSRTVPASGPLALGDVALAPRVSRLGTVAGQNLAHCKDAVLPANDDSSSEEVDLPFEVDFYGTSFDSLYVNNNGNVTFGGSLGAFTPSAVNGPTSQPIIAPFFADVDTSGEGSNEVTYGASPDGRSFCVNWADVGFFDGRTDKLNTFQLVLTSNENSPGRVEGDFDIRFNYDEILWETGDASGGEDGFGGTSAVAGFSAGTGEPGSFVQLPGSLVNGAFVDGGPNALVAGSQNSPTQVGRYQFEVRNDGFESSLGSLQGSVTTAADEPVADAAVTACTDVWVCSYGDTGDDGEFAFSALGAGTYTISVEPPTDDLFAAGTSATVVAGSTTTVAPIVLRQPTPLPPNVELSNNGTVGGVPSVYYGDPLDFRVSGCAGVASPTYTVTLATGEVIRAALPLTPGAAGVYTAVIAPLAPHTGAATITTNIPATCGAAPVAFDLYIDPAGVVSDQWGRPISGAEVTLYRSETFDGDYEMVPDGSTIMSEANRDNPTVTGGDGFFQWLVQPGFYQVRAEAGGCESRTTGGMQIEPERTALAMKLTCDVAPPAPTAAPSVTGSPVVGQSIGVAAGTWPAPLVANVELLRDGVPVTTPYRVEPGDVGVPFVARATARTPDAQSDEGPGGSDLIRIVSFEAVTVTSAPVEGTPAGPSNECTAARAALARATTALTAATAKVAQASKKLAAAKKALSKAKATKKKAKIAQAKKKVKTATAKRKAAVAAQKRASSSKAQAAAAVTRLC